MIWLAALPGCDEQPAGQPRLSVEADGDAVHLGDISCGDLATRTFRLRNLGDADLEYDVSDTLDEVSVAPATGTLAPHASVELHVLGQIGRAAIPGKNLEGHILIRSNAATDVPALLPLSIRVTGAEISARPVTDLGVRPPQFGALGKIELTYRGTAPLSLVIGDVPPPFTISGSHSRTLQQSEWIDVAMPALMDRANPSATVPLQFRGAFCGSAPTSVELVALSSDAPVTADRNVLDFGEIGCTSKSAEVTIAQAISTPREYRVNNSSLDLVLQEPPTGTINGSATFHFETKSPLSLAALQSGRVSGSVTVAVAPLDAATVQVQGTVRRAELTASSSATSPISFGEVALGGSELKTFTLFNRGNALAHVEVDLTNVSRDLTVSPSRFFLPPGKTRELTVVVNPKSGAPGTPFSLPFRLTSTESCEPLEIGVSGTVGARE